MILQVLFERYAPSSNVSSLLTHQQGTTPYMAIRALEGKMHVKAFDVRCLDPNIYYY